MPVNVKLLKKVRKLIAEEPRRLRMKWWGRNNLERFKNPPPCGTVHCLAGHIISASTPKRERAKLFNGRGDMHSWFYRGKPNSSGNRYIAGVAARRIGLKEDDCPFYKYTWRAPQVLAWIDRQIDAASK